MTEKVIRAGIENLPRPQPAPGAFLNAPAQSGGSFVIGWDKPITVNDWPVLVKHMWRYTADDLEEFDMFEAEPGWRISLEGLEKAVKLGYKIVLNSCHIIPVQGKSLLDSIVEQVSACEKEAKRKKEEARLKKEAEIKAKMEEEKKRGITFNFDDFKKIREEWMNEKKGVNVHLYRRGEYDVISEEGKIVYKHDIEDRYPMTMIKSTVKLKTGKIIPVVYYDFSQYDWDQWGHWVPNEYVKDVEEHVKIREEERQKEEMEQKARAEKYRQEQAAKEEQRKALFAKRESLQKDLVSKYEEELSGLTKADLVAKYGSYLSNKSKPKGDLIKVIAYKLSRIESEKSCPI